MDQFRRLKNEMERAQLQINLLEAQYKEKINKYEKMVSEYNQKMINCYADFFNQKKNQEFKVIERYPSFEVFQT